MSSPLPRPIPVPLDADPDWDPPGYEPGADDPGPVTHVHDHGEGDKALQRPEPQP